MQSTDWVFKLHWLTPLLTAWLRLPRRLRLSTVAVTILCAPLVVCGIYVLRTDEPRQPVLRPVHLDTVTRQASVRSLPALTSAALYELTQELDKLAINQQRDNFNITFTAKWHAFASFMNQLAESNLAPQSYRLLWNQADSIPLSGHRTLTMDLQLSPGRYQTGSAPAITLAAIDNQPSAPSTEISNDCHIEAFPAIKVQAAWPSRGYIQIWFNGRSERLTLNQVFENSWQLLRIGSESVEFRWHAAAPSCPKAESFTVAI